jgi:hypothetical protein
MIATRLEVLPICVPSILESSVSQASGRLWAATCLGVTAPDRCTPLLHPSLMHISRLIPNIQPLM